MKYFSIIKQSLKIRSENERLMCDVELDTEGDGEDAQPEI